MRSSIRTTLARTAVLGGLVLIGAALALPVEAAPAPPGNNGVVKIDGWDLDDHPGTEPHVGCTFGVDFYGYEASLPVTIVLEAQPPTGTAVVHTSTGVLDADDATGGGSEAGHDGHFAIDLGTALAAFPVQPQQGYHLKLTVTVDDATPQGADTKSKVFWVTGCEPPTTTTTTTTTTTEPEPTTTTTTTTTTEPEPTTTTTTTTEPEATTTTTTTEPVTPTTGPGEGTTTTTTTVEGTTTTTLPPSTEPVDGTTTTTAPVGPTSTSPAAPTTSGPTPPTIGPAVVAGTSTVPTAVASATQSRQPREVVTGTALPRTGMGSGLLLTGSGLLLLGLVLKVSAVRTQRRHGLTG